MLLSGCVTSAHQECGEGEVLLVMFSAPFGSAPLTLCNISISLFLWIIMILEAVLAAC